MVELMGCWISAFHYNSEHVPGPWTMRPQLTAALCSLCARTLRARLWICYRLVSFCSMWNSNFTLFRWLVNWRTNSLFPLRTSIIRHSCSEAPATGITRRSAKGGNASYWMIRHPPHRAPTINSPWAWREPGECADLQHQEGGEPPHNHRPSTGRLAVAGTRGQIFKSSSTHAYWSIIFQRECVPGTRLTRRKKKIPGNDWLSSSFPISDSRFITLQA